MAEPSKSDEVHDGGTGATFNFGDRTTVGDVAGRDMHKWAELAIAAGTLGPFVTACCTELGKRFGGTLADWASQIRRTPGHSGSTRAELPVKVDDAVTVLELEEGLPDEARLALLDLDFSDQAIRGRRLRWNTEAQMWMPPD